MANGQSTHLQRLIDRLNQGDDVARRELIGCAADRLHRLAGVIFNRDFPRLRNLHDTGSVLSESVLRLMRALEEYRPANVRDFFRFAALQMRRVLLDMARQAPAGDATSPTAPGDNSSGSPGDDPGDTSTDPAQIALWTDFHRKMGELPEDEHAVVDLYYYHGLTQEQTAHVLGLTQRTVSRLWLRIRLKLADALPPELENPA